MLKYWLLDLSIVNDWFMYLDNLLLLFYVLPVRQIEVVSQWLNLNRLNNYSLFYTDKDYSDMKKYALLDSFNNKIDYIDKYNFDMYRHFILNDIKDITYFIAVNYPKLFKNQFEVYDVIKKYKNILSRKKRCKRKIEKLLRYSLDNNLKPVFATFTINNDNYNKKLEYYLLKLKRLLKSHFDYYIINVDYGELKDRLHFHVILSDTINNLSLWSKDITYWGLGCINVKKIRLSKDSFNNDCIYKLNNYLNKLSNHATKDSTRQTKLIYSRGL